MSSFRPVFELFVGAEVSFVYIFLFIFVLFFFSRFIFLSVKIGVVDPS